MSDENVPLLTPAFGMGKVFVFGSRGFKTSACTATDFFLQNRDILSLFTVLRREIVGVNIFIYLTAPKGEKSRVRQRRSDENYCLCLDYVVMMVYAFRFGPFSATAVGILAVKFFVEAVLYARPVLLRVAQNVYAFAEDAGMRMAGLPVCMNLMCVLEKRFP